MRNKIKQNLYLDNVFIHMTVWLIVFGLPLFLTDRGQGVNWSHFWRQASVMLGFMIVFYVNYLYLIDKYLYKQKTAAFIFINLLLIIVIGSLMYMLKIILFRSILRVVQEDIVGDIKHNIYLLHVMFFH